MNPQKQWPNHSRPINPINKLRPAPQVPAVRRFCYDLELARARENHRTVSEPCRSQENQTSEFTQPLRSSFWHLYELKVTARSAPYWHDQLALQTSQPAPTRQLSVTFSKPKKVEFGTGH